MTRFMFLAATAFTLVGCASTNIDKDFHCAAQDGTACATIGEADRTSKSGKVQPITEREEDRALKSLSQPPLGTDKATGTYAGMPDGGYAYQTSRYRIPEEVGRIWIAPYLDENQILHEGQYVHFVISEGRWVNR